MSFIRFGEIPPGERSINFMKMSFAVNEDFTYECENFGAEFAYSRVDEKYLECGVSVFEIDDNGKPIALNDGLKKALDFRLKEKCVCYLVDGDVVGYGHDGEPLLRNIKIIRQL